MPELSRFYGIIIRMFYGDHSPPHFHALYQVEEVQGNIDTLTVITGRMPRRALGLVLEWGALHRDELRRAWSAASRNQEPDKNCAVGLSFLDDSNSRGKALGRLPVAHPLQRWV